MTQTISIDGRLIGSDHPTYIIAEIGINHNGNPDIAKALVDAAAQAGVHAVKFQKRCLESLYSADVLQNTDKYEQNFQYMIPLLKEVELSEETMADLKDYAESQGLTFICTPFDLPSAEFLHRIGVAAFKIASADLNNCDLVHYVAGLGKPMIVSTGMSYWPEIQQTVGRIKASGSPFALLHCRSSYPVWPREVNLRMIDRLKTFGVPVGYSGHDIGIIIPLIAASMGACIIEKHITLDKTMDGPDHKISLEPFELKRMVRDISVSDQAMGKEQRFLLRGEVLNRELFGKSLHARCDIGKGEIITRDMVSVIGPGKGLPPSKLDQLVGTRTVRAIPKGAFFSEEDINASDTHLICNDFKSEWGLIARYDDFEAMVDFRPKVIEFHFTENDLTRAYLPPKKYEQSLVVHAPEYMGHRLFDLCAENESIRKESLGIVSKTVEIAGRLAPYFNGAAPKIIAHPGAMSLNTKLKRDVLKRRLKQSVNEMNARGFEILLENLPPYPWYFGGAWKGNYFMSAEEIASFCDETGMNICFDLSHAALYCNAKNKRLTDFIKTVYPYIRHIHFADGYGLDGEGVQIGEGDIDFDAVMPLFKDYRGTWVPEIWRGHLSNSRGFIEALKRLSTYGL
ncbi:N-acetylneuraminate synthase family protein [Desulfatiferula olefinivorans]